MLLHRATQSPSTLISSAKASHTGRVTAPSPPQSLSSLGHSWRWSSDLEGCWGFEGHLLSSVAGNSHSFLKMKSDIRELPQTSIPHLLAYQQFRSTFPPVTMDKPSVSAGSVPLVGAAGLLRHRNQGGSSQGSRSTLHTRSRGLRESSPNLDPKAAFSPEPSLYKQGASNHQNDVGRWVRCCRWKVRMASQQSLPSPEPALPPRPPLSPPRPAPPSLLADLHVPGPEATALHGRRGENL
uniref:dapper homolog 3-like n=1 Tax=Halichoerus grypus TaxID=9711 RepID=UPI001658CDB9|nr:dapper homolog 3-like [Halichoerus grypus]